MYAIYIFYVMSHSKCSLDKHVCKILYQPLFCISHSVTSSLLLLGSGYNRIHHGASWNASWILYWCIVVVANLNWRFRASDLNALLGVSPDEYKGQHWEVEYDHMKQHEALYLARPLTTWIKCGHNEVIMRLFKTHPNSWFTRKIT